MRVSCERLIHDCIDHKDDSLGLCKVVLNYPEGGLFVAIGRSKVLYTRVGRSAGLYASVPGNGKSSCVGRSRRLKRVLLRRDKSPAQFQYGVFFLVVPLILSLSYAAKSLEN